MTKTTAIEALSDRLSTMARGPRRCFAALAGPPGAGKSHVADELMTRLAVTAPGATAILPMDGYHFDDMLLNARGDRPRKGAPHTFDVDGFHAMLTRLAADDGRDVVVPVFDRSLEIARAGARVIDANAHRPAERAHPGKHLAIALACGGKAARAKNPITLIDDSGNVEVLVGVDTASDVGGQARVVVHGSDPGLR